MVEIVDKLVLQEIVVVIRSDIHRHVPFRTVDAQAEVLMVLGLVLPPRGLHLGP